MPRMRTNKDQKMRIFIAAAAYAAAAIMIASPLQAQVSCWAVGPTFAACNNGQSSQTIGNQTFYNGGARPSFPTPPPPAQVYVPPPTYLQPVPTPYYGVPNPYQR